VYQFTIAFECLLTIFPFRASILNLKISIETLFIDILTLYQHDQLFTPARKHNNIAGIKLEMH